MKHQTIGSYMVEKVSFTSGFDYIRIILSISVLAWHSYPFTQGNAAANEIANSWVGNFTYFILPMFFALSGFLVTASLERTSSIPKFLWLRAIRLFPALTVEVVLSALVLGPLLTTLPLADYFSDPKFRTYFLNCIGYIHYELPGLFASNPYENIVNVSLWTVPFELECYLAITFFALIRLTRYPKLFLALFFVAITGKSAISLLTSTASAAPSHIGGRQLVLFFLAGILLYLNRSIIPRSGILALVSLAIGFIFLHNSNLVYMAALPIAYITVWLGLLTPPKIPVIMSGDYSYGIYLYAGPVQQTLVNSTEIGKTYIGNVLLSLLFVSLFAAFSWHFIEKPTLKLKKAFK